MSLDRTPEPRTFEKKSPVDGSSLGTFEIASQTEVDRVVARARAAFPRWRDTSIAERLEVVDRLLRKLGDHADRYADIISKDTGKPRVEAINTELSVVGIALKRYRTTAPSILARKKQPAQLAFPGKTAFIEHFPMGVIGVISPWNFPFQLSVMPMVSALIAGNAVVLKPSEVTPLVGELAREWFDGVGLPDGLVGVVQGDGSTGAALTESDIDKIFFTGSVATGRRVMAAAAKRPIPVELELGGKDAFIVCDDAPLERAARAAVWGGFVNCGQACVSVERVFVEAPVYDRFVELVKEELKNVTVGGPDEEADMGPMTFPKQLEIVERHVKDAIDRGARVISGGARLARPGTFYGPTVLLDVTEDMEIYREETFGPVLPIVKVKDWREAVKLANHHQYGLSGSVWTRDIDKGLRLASMLECGQVMINEVLQGVGHPDLPFGGVKNSGIGRYHGAEGLLTFTHTKGILLDRGFLKSEPFWFPYKGNYAFAKAGLEALSRGRLPTAVFHFARMLRF